MPSSPVVLKADKRYRLLVLSLSGILLVLGFALLFWGVPFLQAYLNSQPLPLAIKTVQWLLIGLFLSLIPFALYFVGFAWRILNCGCFPPTGAKVLRDTVVLCGRPARRRAYLLLILAGLLFLLAMGGVFLSGYLFQTFFVKM